MKKAFSGYYTPDANFFQRLWKNPILIFDANVLLDFFRYSENVRDEFLTILEKKKDTIWMCHQAAYEYHKNIPNVISEQKQNSLTVIKKIEEVLKIFGEANKYPHIEKNTEKELKKLIEQLRETLKKLDKLLIENPLKERIAKIFEGKVGAPFLTKN